MTKTATFFKMNIQNLYPVIWKEFKERRYRNRTMIVSGIFMIGFLVFLVFQEGAALTTALSVGFMAVYVQLLTMLFIGSAASIYVFYDERMEKTLEPLLCTSLNITGIWLGKVIAVWLVTFLWSIIVMVSFIIVLPLFLSLKISFPLPILLQIFIVSPLLMFPIIALFGILILKTKNIFLARFIIQFPGIFALILLINEEDIFGKLSTAPWKLMGLLLLISLGLMAVIAYCTRFLKKEKIVI